MAFDFDALLQNPTFQTGLGLLGAASQRNAPLLNAYNLLQSQAAARQKAEEEKSQREMEKAKMDLYRQQIEQMAVRTKAEQEKAERAARWREEGLPNLLKQLQPQAAQGVAPSTPQVPGPTMQVTPQKPPSFFRERLLPLESDPKDPWAVSEAGAIGPAQILPKVGPEAARLAGLPWDEKRFRSDAEYNITIGEALFNHHLKTYNGDYAKASAAYHAGAGNLNAAIFAAQAAGRPDDWLRQKPLGPRTRAYVQGATSTPWNPQAAAQTQQVSQVSGPDMQPEITLDEEGNPKISIKPSYERQRMQQSMQQHQDAERRHAQTESRQQELLRLQKEAAERDKTRDRLAAEKAQAELDKPVKEKEQGLARFNTLIGDLRKSYDTLQGGGDIVDPKKGALDNIGAGVRSSVPGQAVEKLLGTKAQSERNKIVMTRPLLMQAIMQATGMTARQLDSNVELQMYLQAATDPSLDIEANKDALNRLQEMFGGGMVNPAQPNKGGQGSVAPWDSEKERRYQEWKRRNGK